MGTGIYYPAANGDDFGWETSWYDNSSNYILLGDGRHIGICFRSVSIPQGAIISSAFVRFTAYLGRSTSYRPVSTNLHFNAVDDVTTIPSNQAEAFALTLTSGTSWTESNVWVDGTTYDSSDIKSEVQAITDRAGWASGNDVLFIGRDNASAPGYFCDISTYEYVSGSEKAELHVVWYAAPVDETASWNPLDAGSNLTFSTDLLTATHA